MAGSCGERKGEGREATGTTSRSQAQWGTGSRSVETIGRFEVEEWAREGRQTSSLGGPGGRALWLGPGEREQSGWRTQVCFGTGATGLGGPGGWAGRGSGDGGSQRH